MNLFWSKVSLGDICQLQNYSLVWINCKWQDVISPRDTVPRIAHFDTLKLIMTSHFMDLWKLICSVSRCSIRLGASTFSPYGNISYDTNYLVYLLLAARKPPTPCKSLLRCTLCHRWGCSSRRCPSARSSGRWRSSNTRKGTTCKTLSRKPDCSVPGIHQKESLQ